MKFERKLYGLDLFSGIGGISKALEDWVKPVAYCDRERFTQAAILARIESGDLDPAPIWDDVTTLRGDMLPPIDIIFGGFPCQDISVAGAGKGLEGERSGLFREIVRLALETKAPFIFLENVPAIRTRGLRQVVGTLTEVGYDCRWTCISASDVGANHKRERWFLLAYSNSHNLRNEQGWSGWQSGSGALEPRHHGEAQPVAYSNSSGFQEARPEQHATGIEQCGVLANSNGLRQLQQTEARDGEGPWSQFGGQHVANSFGIGLEGSEHERQGLGEQQLSGDSGDQVNASHSHSQGLEGQRQEPCRAGTKHTHACDESWWSVEPDVGRVAHGVPLRVDRIKSLGNSVVPLQVKTAFEILIGLRTEAL